ncbi:hydroxymethylpyrimidine/phosphomethylpyrimidine kinase [Alkalitalea saponilacus]|uniref:hydroxymethylpyrimidine kinase n=1 Tax=Alkalitalea saponilacus TaxID=889453 RepID=A0A1T5HSJ5_9BACT|nr:hydroxymethylpyrimidine/phosphomethylpyrimidine kinase [Alkalitalea saponilacus]ASB49992.1 hydroxymethylpyrimidine/phosphomethylpyrimidine kinase [Alkalitalea saponilacus]SKC23500.1 hydroxymethylpyrimidine/phosphomethylpyrimidine kinase [Alkalitalea saponilacus]
MESVVSIGGWDPCGGAGLAADIKTFEMHGVRGMGICSAITSQAHNRFDGLQWTSPEVIFSQLESLLRSYTIKGVKFGIVESSEVLHECIARLRNANPDVIIVWDPVIKASSGFDFHNNNTDDFLEALKLVDLVTPNLPEAEWLFGVTNASDIQKKMNDAAINAIVLKGGHAENHANDLLIQLESLEVIKGERFNNPGKHGSGCVFSAAVCALLAKRNTISEACNNAKKYTEKFILSTNELLGWHYKSLKFKV